MNNNQLPFQIRPQIPQFFNPNLLQELQQENNNLKQEVISLKQQIQDLRNTLNLNLQNQREVNTQNEDKQKIIANLQQKLSESIQEVNNLKITLNQIRNQQENYQILQNRCNEVQLINKELTNELDLIKKNKVFIKIESKTSIQQNQTDEIVLLSFIEKINNFQLRYQVKNKIIEFHGYGEIKGQGFIYNCQCELSRVPKQDQNPQIIQRDKEIILKFLI